MMIEEGSMDKVDMLSERDPMSMEGQDTNTSDTNQHVLIDFQEVINDDGETITQVTEILDTEEVETETPVHESTGMEGMELDECQQEEPETIENVTEKIISDTETVELAEVTEADADMDCSSENVIKKIEPDTEAVSEDELPTEAAAKVCYHKIL